MAPNDLGYERGHVHHGKAKQSKDELLWIIDNLCSVVTLPVPCQRLQFQNQESFPFVINISKITDFECSDQNASSPVQYQVRLTMFDLAYKQFFGRTWTSPNLETKKSGQKIKLDVNQNVYFHTSLSDESIAVVLEIIATATGDDGKLDQWSCGWSLMKVFKYDGKMLDASSSSIAPPQKLTVYHGTPVALVFLDEPIEGNTELSSIPGCTAVYTIRTHQALSKVMHLIDENCIVGTNDVIPGLYDGIRDPKTGVKDPFRKPKLLKPLPGYIDKLSINFSMPLEKLEEDVCRLLNEDRLHKDKENDGYCIEITDRKLLVGVHNGWSYVSDPETVALTPQDSINASLKRAGSKRGHKRSPSTTSLGQASALVYRHRVELDGLLEDPSFCVVFTLIYDVAEAPASKDKRGGARKNPYSVAIRWAAWCPVSNLHAKDQTVNLIGGPGPNPEDMLLFHSQTAESIGSAASLSSLTGGTVTFSFNCSLPGKENAISTMDAANQMLQVPQLSARRQSRGSDEGSGILQEIPVSGRPPMHPSSASPQPMIQASTAYDLMAANQSSRKLSYYEPSTGQDMHHPGMMPVPGIGGSPPQTGYMTGMYGLPPGMAMPYGVTPRGYMPIEIAHLRDSATSMMAPDLQELPFTPLYAPIMAAVPGMQRGQGLSRAAYAKLYSAGFQPILDRVGEPAEVVDPSDVFNFVAAKEDMDRLRANEIHMQFLAYARVAALEAPGASKQPGTVFFTFQFYRYPQVTTERLLLGNADGHLGNDPNAVPCILQRLDKDGSVLKGPPGYMLKYLVDPAYLKPGEGRLFVKHLSQATLHIDVWDGDTLHLIGSCAVDLKHLCRQGREAVQVTYELDIISQDIIDPEGITTAGDPLRDGNVLPAAVSQIIKGRLHLRMANVGHFSEGKFSKADITAQTQNPKLIVKAETGTAFPGGSLHSVNPNVKSLGTVKIARALPLAETNHELAEFLFTRRKETQQEDTGAPGGAERKRKLARLEAVIQNLGDTSNQTISTIRHEKDQRNRDLKMIEMYRKQAKHDGILNMLNKAISSEHTIYPSMGSVEFFEFLLRNPYSVDHTITIDTDDPELIVVTDPREWRHFKMLNEIYTSVEEGMFNTESKSGKPEIFLRPKETVHIPFKFLTFKADHSVQPQAPTDPYRPQTKSGVIQNKINRDPLETRVIKAYFHTQEGKPISILSLKVEPQPHIVDQTFRFYHPEQSFLKKSIRLPPLQTLPGVPVGGAALSQLWVRCSDSNVICTSRKVQQGEPHDIFIKAACGASPQIKRFFMAVYTDPYLSKPIQIWQFYVHALQRVDVNCTEGQTSRFNLLLRGTQASRLVQCFPSHGNEMQVSPKEPFILAANTLQELFVGVRPMQAGSKFLFLNVVDIEYHQLIRSWLVCVASQPSHVVKAYEILLPVGGGKSSNKKISYTNPYPKVKVFYLRTNREDLLQFKESRLELGAGETTNIGLRFAPCMTPCSTEILVFINDEDDKTEETFCVKAIYQ